MIGIPRTIMVKGKPFNAEHKLNEYSHVKSIKQNKRGLGPDCNMATCKETKELTKAGILQKVKYQTWVSNPVMVKKSDGGWRMCVDFTYINKARPKDFYPLPKIDWKIESLSGFQASGSHGLLESSGSDEGLELIQEEDTQPSENTSEIHNEVAPIEVEPQNVEVPIRDLNEPPNYKAALSDPEFDKWLKAVNMEMQSKKDNQVWVLDDLPPNGQTVRSK
ncbi:hypothetical protein Tco_0467772 [Tanacetum coccineum]